MRTFINRRKRELLVSGPSGVHTRDNTSKVHKPMGVTETDTPPRHAASADLNKSINILWPKPGQTDAQLMPTLLNRYPQASQVPIWGSWCPS